MSAFQEAEILFLNEIANHNGLTADEAFSIQTENPAINFGTGTNVINIMEKFLSLGLLDYQSETGKFVYVDSGRP